MKFFSLFYIPIITLLSVAVDVQAQLSHLHVEVRVDSEVQNMGKQNEEKMQRRKLDITVSNISSKPVEKVQVKWWFFARNLKTGHEEILKTGRRMIALGALDRQTVASEQVTSSYEDRHDEKMDSKGGNKKKKSAPKFKSVPASGNKITGYAVQIIENDRIADSYYSSPSYKGRLESIPK
jgi:hypothetical protein